MTFLTINNDADNGMQVNTVVELLIPKNDEPFPKKPWQVTTLVNHSPMYQQEVGEPRSGPVPVLRLLQLLPEAFDYQGHPCYGGRADREALDGGRIA